VLDELQVQGPDLWPSPYTYIDELHRTHIGITKMKQLSRRYVYWKGINKDIEQLLKTCQPYAAVKTNPAKVPVHPWDEPKGNWDHIHIDYAGPFLLDSC
jgi:hypothetical protein